VDGRGVKVKTGSSPNAGEGCPDLQEEMRVAPVSMGDALEDLDIVVDDLTGAFQNCEARLHMIEGRS
jgi:hypothetical protein